MARKGREGDWMVRGRCTEDRGRGVVGHDDGDGVRGECRDGIGGGCREVMN